MQNTADCYRNSTPAGLGSVFNKDCRSVSRDNSEISSILHLQVDSITDFSENAFMGSRLSQQIHVSSFALDRAVVLGCAVVI